MFRPNICFKSFAKIRIATARTNQVVNREFHRSAWVSRNEPKYDDAEIMAERLNEKGYVGKRDKSEYKWEDQSQAEAEKEYYDKMEKLTKLYAVLQGFLIVAGVGAAGTAYLMWPQIKGWWLTKDIHVTDDVIEKLKEKKERKKLSDVPVVPIDSPDSSVPGLYYWGKRLGLGKGEAVSKFPLRVPSFDGKRLRDVSLADGGQYGNLAIDDKGDLYEWDAVKFDLILKDQDLQRVKISNDVAYALNKKGEVLVIPLADKSLLLENISWSRSFLLPWKKYCRYSWKLDVRSAFRYSGERKVADFDVGARHLMLLSNKGKAYTCATGVEVGETEKSRGQFGIPSFSQFDPYPILNKVYEVELLNVGIAGDHVTSRTISKIACGDYHTLAFDSMGELFSFGLNTYGQLGQTISYDMEYVPFPKKVTCFSGHFDKQYFLKCVDIHCAGNTSYTSIFPQDVHEYFRGKDTVNEQDQSKVVYFAFGNGIQGQLGNGHFKHSQADPTKMKTLNDSTGVRTLVKSWYCGEEHALVKLDNGEVLAWGYNENGQLGNGKKIKWDRPAPIPRLLEPGMKYTNQNVADIYKEDNKLVISDQQKIIAGRDSTCLFWEA